MPGDRLQLYKNEILIANIDGEFDPEQMKFIGGEVVTFMGRAGADGFQILTLEFFTQLSMVKVIGLDPKGLQVIAAVVGDSIEDVVKLVETI